MWLKTRLFLVALLVGAVFAQTSVASVSSVNSSKIQTMAASCCPNDCPDMPDCDAACIEAMQCGVAPIVLGLEPSAVDSGLPTDASAFLPLQVTAILHPPTDGLRRPPKA